METHPVVLKGLITHSNVHLKQGTWDRSSARNGQAHPLIRAVVSSDLQRLQLAAADHRADHRRCHHAEVVVVEVAAVAMETMVVDNGAEDIDKKRRIQ